MIETSEATQGTGIAGDYRSYAAFRLRRDMEMRVTDSHSDFFIKGQLAVRLDMRGAIVHYRPTAFGTVTGL